MEAKEMIEVDLSCLEGHKTNLPRGQVVELAQFPSGRIVVMTKQDSLWFESDGISPKGSYLTPMVLVRKELEVQREISFKAGKQTGIQEAVKWIRQYCRDYPFSLIDKIALQEAFELKLKEWGIKPQ